MNDALYLRSLNDMSSMCTPILPPDSWSQDHRSSIAPEVRFEQTLGIPSLTHGFPLPSTGFESISEIVTVIRASGKCDSSIKVCVGGGEPCLRRETLHASFRLKNAEEDIATFAGQLNAQTNTRFAELSGLFPVSKLDSESLLDSLFNFSARPRPAVSRSRFITSNPIVRLNLDQQSQRFARRDVSRGFSQHDVLIYESWSTRQHLPSALLSTSDLFTPLLFPGSHSFLLIQYSQCGVPPSVFISSHLCRRIRDASNAQL